MSNGIDFDRFAEAWLADGPTELADRVLDAALREVHVTDQRRLTPWRTFQMTFLPSGTGARALVAAALAIVAVGGAIYVLSPRQGTGGPTVTSSPSPAVTPPATGASTAAPRATPLPAAADVTSAMYGYTVHIPAGWTVTLATARWDGTSAVSDADPIVDQLDPPQMTGRCQQASLCAPINWAYARPWTGDLASWKAYIDAADSRDHPCPAKPESATPITIDGTAATLEAKHCEPITGILVLTALTVREGTAFAFYSQDQSHDPSVESVDRSDFLRLLSAVALP